MLASRPVPDLIDLPILGMTCASCVTRVEGALRAVPGVREASVNLVSGRATVRTDAATSRDALADAIERAGYRVPAAAAPAVARSTAAEGADAEDAALRRDLLFAAVLTLPLLVLGMSHGAIPGADGPVGRWVQLLLATPVVFGPGRRFLRGALAAARHRAADMNTLVSLGVGAAWMWSAVAVLAPGLFPHAEHGHLPHVYFEAAGAILTFVLLGKVLEGQARRRLADAVRGLVALQPASALRLVGEVEEEVAVEALRPGDLVLLRPGGRVPVDGEVVHGVSAVDESMLTGEGLPVDKDPGSEVFAGTLLQGPPLVVRVAEAGEGTALQRIVQAVEQAQGSKAPIARLADRVSAWFVPAVLAVAAITFLVWAALDPTTTGLAVAVQQTVAVLVIACPCALGLATPAAVAVGTGRGAELGVLVKGGAPLEAASRVDTVLLDKTGTLTAGRPTLTDVVAIDGQQDALLALVASAERGSEHPVAHAIVAAARDRGLPLLAPDGVLLGAGGGIEARVGDRSVRIGTSAWIRAAGVDVAPLEGQASVLAADGRTPAFVAVDGALAGLVAVADRAVPGAKAALLRLAEMGLDLVMVTGDRRETAFAVARELGIDTVEAEVLPAQKAAVVERYRAMGRRVAMVGDGINDAPALAAADVGIAIGTGTDIAAATADITLMRGGIEALPTALALSRSSLRTIRQNLFWAFVYNTASVPVAAGLLYPLTGWLLSPVLASAAMAASSVSVLLNSLRLRRFSGPTSTRV